MKSNEALRGKPVAGNQHVRLDEGEVASYTTVGRPEWVATRGGKPLLYKKLMVAAAALGVTLGVLAKNYTPEISEGAIVFGEIDEDSTITIASGTTVTSSTPISGTGSLAVSGGGTLVLSGVSPDYSGDIAIDGTVVSVAAESALGTGTVSLDGTAAQLRFVTGSFGKTYANDIAISGASTSAQVLYFEEQQAKQRVTFSGAVTVDGSVQFYATWAGARNVEVAEFTGSLTVGGTLYLNSYNKDKKACTYWLRGRVCAKELRAVGDATTYSTPTVYLKDAENAIGLLTCDYKSKFTPETDEAFGGAAYQIINVNRTAIDLNGKNQTMAYVSSSVTKQDLGHVTTASAATMTLTGGVATASCCSWIGLDGSLSLVIDDKGEAGTFTQTFAGDASNGGKGATHMAMSGDILVKRGKLAFTGYYRLPNVPSISIDNGSLTMNTTADVPAFPALQSLTIGAHGTLTVSTTTANPFPLDSTMDLSLMEGATLNLPSSVTEIFACNFTWNGKGQKIGDYTHATCSALPEGVTLHVANAPSETVEEITWVGGAADDAVTRAGNWKEQVDDPLDLSGNKYLATFAESGETATVTGEASFHGIVFAGSGFSILGSSALLDVYESGVAIADDQEKNETGHVYTIEPTLVAKFPLAVSVPVNDTLVLSNGISSACDIWMDGRGKVKLHGVSDFTGTLSVSNGGFACTGTLGDPATEEGIISVYAVDGLNSTFAFSNAVVNKKLRGTSYQPALVELSFSGDQTNYVRRAVTMGNRSYNLSVASGSVVVFEGGVSGGMKTWFGGGGTTVVRNKKASFGASAANPMSTQSGGGKLVLQVADNDIKFVNPNDNQLTVRTEVDWALGGTAGVTQYSLHSRGALDLTDTRQLVRDFKTDSAGVLTGTAGGVLELAPTGGVWTVNCKVQGAASIQVGGAANASVVLTNQAFASHGNLTVKSGVLELAEDASWLNGTNFTARGEGGLLKFASSAQVDKKIARLHFAENGKVYVPAGVTLKVVAADVLQAGASEPTRVASGTYDGSSGPLFGRIEGGGNVRVGSAGLILLFR